MHIRKILINIYDFFKRNRRSGTTTLLKEIASKNDVHVIVVNHSEKKEFGDSAITLEDFQKMRLLSPKPILVDNHVLLKITEDSLDQFNKYEIELRRRNELILNIENLIEDFKSGKDCQTERQVIKSNLPDFISSVFANKNKVILDTNKDQYYV